MYQKYDYQYFIAHDHLELHTAETIKNFIIKNNLRKVLDVGCGTGKLVKYLNDFNISALGCDNNRYAVKFSQKHSGNNKIKLASATKLPYRSRYFDMIIGLSIIEHLSASESHKFIKETYRVLKPGGYIFLATPNISGVGNLLFKSNWFGYFDKTHKQFFNIPKLSQMLKKYKYKNITTTFQVKFNFSCDWNLPINPKQLPRFIRFIINYLLISSPLANFRDSFWIAAQK